MGKDRGKKKKRQPNHKKQIAQETNEMLRKRARISFLQSALSPAYTIVHRFF